MEADRQIRVNNQLSTAGFNGSSMLDFCQIFFYLSEALVLPPEAHVCMLGEQSFVFEKAYNKTPSYMIAQRKVRINII